MDFEYFDLRNCPKGELKKVRANKIINTENYRINELREVEPNVYLVIYQKGFDNKIKEEDPLFKFFIIDATIDEQSASVRQISLSFDNNPKYMEMKKKYPFCCSYFIDLG